MRQETLSAILVACFAAQAAGAADDLPATSAYDTGSPLAARPEGAALAGESGWSALAEGVVDHRFRGDAVLANGRLALVLRRGAAGAEVFARGPGGWAHRATLAPADRARLKDVKLLKSTIESVAAEAAFVSGRQTLGLRFQLDPGEPVVETAAGAGTKALRVEAPCRFGVLPDSFADDIVIDAAAFSDERARIPSEHFFLHMAAGGEAVVAVVWDVQDQEIGVQLDAPQAERKIAASEISFAPKGRVWVGVLEGPNVWHGSALAPSDAGKVVPTGWTMPFPACWRADFTDAQGMAASWELIREQPDGRFHFMKPRLDFNGRTEKTFPADRLGWSTVLGRFTYPCWVDRAGHGFFEPAGRGLLQYAGPVLVYPLDRSPKTPLECLTFTDLVRMSLGVGPCRYILDLEGQESTNKGIYTCGARNILDGIYRRGEQKEKRQEIEQTLRDVVVFVKAIRARIEAYRAFGRELRSYLAEQKEDRPVFAPFLDEMDRLAAQIEVHFGRRQAAIKTPEHVADLTDRFRRDLLDDGGPDTYEKCRAITSQIVRVGDNQDELVAECRRVVKILRQQAGLAVAKNPETAPVAREIRSRAQKVLRRQLGHEGSLYR